MDEAKFVASCQNNKHKSTCVDQHREREVAGLYTNISSSIPKQVCDTKNSSISNFILVGLHACGDLTPTMMRVFVNCPAACSLAFVACCYHKLNR